MNPDGQHIKQLYELWLNGRATLAEEQEFKALLNRMDSEELLSSAMRKVFEETEDNEDFSSEQRRLLAKNIIKKYSVVQEKVEERTHRRHFLRTAWVRYAAAIIILLGLGSGTYFWLTNTLTEDPTITQTNPEKKDILPGGNKAVLTLADGSTIILDSAANGQLATQGNARIEKDAEGQIIYTTNGIGQKEVLMNTMSTPRGGQYQLRLPDGTQVWLNAASSITYPAVFVGNDRKVKVTGEVYLEVKADKNRPFLLNVNDQQTVEVLGTQFNVNSYTDEKGVKTTLIEGSVQTGGKVLKPGQAWQNGTIVQTDVAQDIAWKNGVFNFNNLDLPAILRQLARWYDLDVVYEGQPTAGTFRGKMSRNLTLSQVLILLEGLNVRFSIEGKVLTVKNQS